jgi:hypothetical protein
MMPGTRRPVTSELDRSDAAGGGDWTAHSMLVGPAQTHAFSAAPLGQATNARQAG